MIDVLLKKHLSSYFVESGSHTGRCIDIALKVGFSNIISIEIEEKYYKICIDKFKDNNNVVLYHADSLDVLWEIIEPINKQITFWLDGHIHPSAIVGKYKVPLLQELKIIAKHSIKNHKILIDDINYFGKTLPPAFKEDRDAWFDISKEKVIEAVLNINSKYCISYAPHLEGSREDKILIAIIKDNQ